MDSSVLKWLDMARIDIKNQGTSNDVKVTEGENCSVTQPRWFSKDGAGYVIETSDKHLVLVLECRGAGKLLLRLQGIDRRSPGGDRLPLWVDYTGLKVNGEEVFRERRPLWHDKSYSFTRQVIDGEKIRVEISWEAHSYQRGELARLISLWSSLPMESKPREEIPRPRPAPVLPSYDYVRELHWAQIYHDTIIGSKWLKDKAISPGGVRGWAVGYNFLYVLYRVLEEMKPRRILELGLGQSTKLTSQYAECYGAEHVVVEHDREWESFFRLGFQIPPITRIVQRNLVEKQMEGQKYFAYEDFTGAVKEISGPCNLILVDGPFGGRSERSRRDIVPHLPKILAEDFVIMVDDCGRKGEENLLQEIKGILDRERIGYAEGIYRSGGTCHVGVVVCRKWRFLTSM